MQRWSKTSALGCVISAPFLATWTELMLALGTLTEGGGGEGWLLAGCALRNLDEKQKQGKTRLSTAASTHLRAWAESGRARNLHFFPRF